MNVVLLFLLLLKATITSFSGLTSLPVLRNDLVVRHRVLTDRQLNAAVVAGRTAPGPYGLYVVSVGYFVAGVPGAIAGWLAMVAPAFLIIPMLRYLGSRAGNERVRGAIQGVTFAASGLTVSAAIPLARDAITTPLAAAIGLTGFCLLVWGRMDVLWIIAGSAAAGLAGAVFI